MKTKCSPRGQSPKPTLSAAKLAANRQNAQKSTGPRTPEGKARSSHNATKHGLATAARDPGGLEKVTVLAAAFAEGSTDWDVRAYAHSVAEAQLDLERVREARVLEHEAAGPGFSNKERSPAGWVLRLFRLERYERRAFSRRERAIRGLEAAKAGPWPGSALVECGRQVIAEFWQNEPSGAACDTSDQSWQNEASEARSVIPQNEASGAPDGIRQIEATGAFNGYWRNEPSMVTGEIRQIEATEALAEVLQDAPSGVSDDNLQNEASGPSTQDAAPQAGRPEAGSAPTLASDAAVMDQGKAQLDPPPDASNRSPTMRKPKMRNAGAGARPGQTAAGLSNCSRMDLRRRRAGTYAPAKAGDRQNGNEG